jgi:hypothetical protein
MTRSAVGYKFEQVLVDRYSGAGEGPRIEIVSVVMVIVFIGKKVFGSALAQRAAGR